MATIPARARGRPRRLAGNRGSVRVHDRSQRRPPRRHRLGRRRPHRRWPARAGQPRRRRHADILARRARGEIGFLDLPDDVAGARACVDFAAGLDPAIDTMVVLGIGGSSLGPRALYSALAPAFDPLRPRTAGGPRRLFFPDNVDPATFAALLELLPPGARCGTWSPSPAAPPRPAPSSWSSPIASSARWAPRARKHLVFTTDPERGALPPHRRRRRLPVVPGAAVGGWSVLGAVPRWGSCRRRSPAST
ncbi:MAG: hypothetical protein R2939_14295 [Kofleriaceae bacterium]